MSIFGLIRFPLFILAKYLPRISAPLREELNAVIRRLYVHAQGTDNPFDDLAVETLAQILDVDLKEESKPGA